uniref:Uncharacterized protein n=1 Tax=Anopheles atroparvus TaxID=41427 RepID=A0A182ISW8_ANOAO
MTFQLIAILATFACVSASYVPVGLNLPYTGYGGSPIHSSVLSYGTPYAAYNHAPQLALQNVHPALLQQVQSPLVGNYIHPQLVPVTDVVPAGKTTLTKTFVSTPTYVTSHVSERLHTDEPVRPIYNNYGYGKNVINAVPSLRYAVNYAAPVAHGIKYGW